MSTSLVNADVSGRHAGGVNVDVSVNGRREAKEASKAKKLAPTFSND